jgi:hypothetical protein
MRSDLERVVLDVRSSNGSYDCCLRLENKKISRRREDKRGFM